MADKVDLKKTLASYRARAGSFDVLEVPTRSYLMVDGRGDPNTSPAYAEALAALYPVAYAVKFASKAELGRDYVVPPLEGLWWADDMDAFTRRRDKAQWSWTLMILVPEWVPAALIEQVRGRAASPHRERVRREELTEGLCVQTLHLGPYDDEGPVLAEMHDVFIPSAGLRMTGTHHEIYLGDPRRTAPARLRTILRQPVERVPEDR